MPRRRLEHCNGTVTSNECSPRYKDLVLGFVPRSKENCWRGANPIGGTPAEEFVEVGPDGKTNPLRTDDATSAREHPLRSFSGSGSPPSNWRDMGNCTTHKRCRTMASRGRSTSSNVGCRHGTLRENSPNNGAVHSLHTHRAVRYCSPNASSIPIAGHLVPREPRLSDSGDQERWSSTGEAQHSTGGSVPHGCFGSSTPADYGLHKTQIRGHAFPVHRVWRGLFRSRENDDIHPYNHYKQSAVLFARDITAPYPLRRNKKEEATAEPLHINNVSRKDFSTWRKLVECLPPFFVNIFDKACEGFRLCSQVPVDDCAPPRCNLLVDDIDRLLAAGLITHFDGCVTGHVFCFTVNEVEKKRRRWITHPAAQNNAIVIEAPITLTSIGRICKTSFGISAICLDIKSCFHQFSLPKELQAAFTFTDKSGMLYTLTSIPTGSNLSPQLGHIGTMGLVAFSLRRLKIQFNVHDNIFTSTFGISIIVHIDNIRILTPCPTITTNIARCITLTAAQFDITLNDALGESSTYEFLGTMWHHVTSTTTKTSIAPRTLAKVRAATSETLLTVRACLSSFSRLQYASFILRMNRAAYYHV